jgi:hypothetical protein
MIYLSAVLAAVRGDRGRARSAAALKEIRHAR